MGLDHQSQLRDHVTISLTLKGLHLHGSGSPQNRIIMCEFKGGCGPCGETGEWLVWGAGIMLEVSRKRECAEVTMKGWNK